MTRTIITRKQAGVIYRNVKQGSLSMSKAAVSAMYDVVDRDSRDCMDPMLDDMIGRLLEVVDAVFDGMMERAQGRLDTFCEMYALED